MEIDLLKTVTYVSINTVSKNFKKNTDKIW